MLPRFQVAHPEFDVFLRLSDYLVDRFTESVDVAVRMAVLSDSSLIVRRIAAGSRNPRLGGHIRRGRARELR